jgi:hypothetical protein
MLWADINVSVYLRLEDATRMKVPQLEIMNFYLNEDDGFINRECSIGV